MDIDKKIEIFIPSFLDELNVPKLSFIDIVDNYLIVLYDTTLTSYEISSSGKITIINQVLACKNVGTALVCESQLKQAYVLSSSGSFYLFPLPTLGTGIEHRAGKEKEASNLFHFIVKNLDTKHPNELLAITKKKKLIFYKYNPEVAKLTVIENKKQDLQVVDLPEKIKWFGNNICYTVKDKLYFFNIESGQVIEQLFSVAEFTFVKDSWLLDLEDIGIFMIDGQPKNIDSISFKKDEIVEIKTFKNFIVSLHRTMIGIYDSSNSKELQIIPIKINLFRGTFLVSNANRLLYVIANEGKFQVWELKDLPVDIQIRKFLSQNQVNEALGVLNNNYLSTDESKPGHIEQFFLDCAWTHVRNHNYQTAANFLKMTNFNPCDFIYMFINQLSVAPLHEEFVLSKQDEIGKQRIMQLQIETLANDPAKVTEALIMLKDILVSKRNYLLKNYEMPKDNYIKLSFLKSQLSIIDSTTQKKEIQISTLLQLITITLVKTLVKLKDSLKQIGEVIDNDPFENTDYFSDKFLDSEEGEERQATKAMIYEKRNNFEEALKIWRKFGMERESTVIGFEARQRTIKILTSFKEHKNNPNNLKLFQEYIKWLLAKRPDVEVFKVILSTDFSVDYILSNIIPQVGEQTDKPQRNDLKEKFLDHLNTTKPDEKYTTMLIMYYIELLFSIREKDSKKLLEKPDRITYDKLKTLMTEGKSSYNCDTILPLVKGSWMKDVELILYSKKGKYTEALKKLIAIGLELTDKGEFNDFKGLEEYCKKNSKELRLYEEAYTLLASEYNNELKQPDCREVIAKRSLYKKEMLKFLADFREALDPMVVIDNTPGNWEIDDPILDEYLTFSLIELSHFRNKFDIAKNAVDVDLLYKKNDVFEDKKKSITITNDTFCDFCRKKIGSTIFCVYPNMKIYHSKCALNPHLDPTTRIDFSKKFF